jgi:hypothetical protein
VLSDDVARRAQRTGAEDGRTTGAHDGVAGSGRGKGARAAYVWRAWSCSRVAYNKSSQVNVCGARLERGQLLSGTLL